LPDAAASGKVKARAPAPVEEGQAIAPGVLALPALADAGDLAAAHQRLNLLRLQRQHLADERCVDLEVLAIAFDEHVSPRRVRLDVDQPTRSDRVVSGVAPGSATRSVRRKRAPFSSITPFAPAIPSSRLSAMRRARSMKWSAAAGGQTSRAVASNNASQRSKCAAS